MSPAWRRFSITQLALAQRRWLCDELAARGFDAHAVIVADDENLDVAAQYGFDTVELDNDGGLGRRFNAGFRYAAGQGADYLVHVGSDDWVHPDVFDALSTDDLNGPGVMPDPTPGNPIVWKPGERMLTHRKIGLVDLGRGIVNRCVSRGRYGVIPWVIPRSLMEKSGFAPCQPDLERGIDGDLYRRLGCPKLLFDDTHDLACVDFKSAVNVTTYKSIVYALGSVEEPAWEALRAIYPSGLVDLAERTRPEPVKAWRRPRPSAWFIVPANGRSDHATVCLRQLARTCETLTENGLDASAVVVADDENLEQARDLGFATVRRENEPLGRKWNDGYQLAADTATNSRPARFTVPIGSDDWIDPYLLLTADLREDRVTCFRQAAFVNEDGTRLAPVRIPYDGGIGIRVIPTRLLARAGYRPAEEDRKRAIDASVFRGLRQPPVHYHETHPLQIVDFKSHTDQLNPYHDCLRYLAGEESETPWDDLAEVFPADAVAEMRAVYSARERVAA